MTERLGHVGMVVRSIDETWPGGEKVLGAVLVGHRSCPGMGRVSSAVRRGDVPFELMKPLETARAVPTKLIRRRHGRGGYGRATTTGRGGCLARYDPGFLHHRRLRVRPNRILQATRGYNAAMDI